MQPRKFARATSFGPDDLKLLFRAYDEAWSEIAPKIGTEPATVETARMALATIVFGLAANTDPTTRNGLGALAVAVFCAKHHIAVERAGKRAA